MSAGRPAAPLKRADLLGKVWVADFVFTHCTGPCPILSNNMALLQKKLPASVGLLTLTVDPDRDDPKALAAYAERFRADPSRWLFVTGKKGPLLELLIRGFKLPAVEDPKAESGQRVTHSTRFALIDAKGRIRGYFDGEDPDALVALERAIARVK